MAYFDELLQRAITVRNNRAPASNTADLVGGVLVSIVSALQMLLDDKQDELTFDTAPTADSPNPVTSDGIYQALQAIDLSACEKIVNKVTSINAQSTNVQYPTAKLLYDSLQALSGIYAAIVHTHAIADIINLQTELDARQLVSNLVTAITAQSTDLQYPSAKLLYDQLALKANQSTTYTKTEVDALIGALSTISFAVVQQLPTSDIQTNVIYLVPAAQPGQSNIYNEYIYVNNNWELIGSTSIDLSGYEQTANKVTALTAQSTDVQYPSAKAVYDCCIVVKAAINSLDERVTRLEAFHYETYYIRGKSTNTGGTETFTITMLDILLGTTSNVAFTANVDANGDWEVEYKGKKIYSLSAVFQGKTTITSIAMTEELDECISLSNTFRNCTALTSVTFDSRLNLHKVTTIGNYINNNQAGIFSGCTALTSVSQEFFAQNFDALTVANGAFNGCTAYTAAIVFSGTMPLLNDTRIMFNGCAAASVTFTNAAMANVTNVGAMFNALPNATLISMPAATFATLTVAGCTPGGPMYGLIHNCPNLVTIDLSAATFASLTDARNMFRDNANLETISWGANINLNALVYAGDGGYHTTGMFAGCAKLNTASVAVFANLTLASLRQAQRMFNGCAAITALDFSAATFASLTTAQQMFNNCTSLVTIDLSAATFASLEISDNMFSHCEKLAALDLSAATFSNLTNMADMFGYCKAMQSLTFSNNLNLNKVTTVGNTVNSNTAGLFRDCTALTTVSQSFFSQNFAELVSAWGMFRNCGLTSITLSGTLPKLAASHTMFCDSKATSITINSTLASLNNPIYMFSNAAQVTTINMPNATFELAADTRDMFYQCSRLTSLVVPNNSTAVAPTAGANVTPINTRWSALTYTSMLNIANWLRNFTGGNAHTVTFKTSAWNALTAAEQSNIDTILSGKNWTRVLG